MTRPAGLVLVLAIVAWTACSDLRIGEQLYTVTTTVMLGECDSASNSPCRKPGQLPVACFATPLSYAPIGCGGVDLEGLDPRSVPGSVTYSNGVVATKTLTLVGTWTGDALVLTDGAQIAKDTDHTPLPQCHQTPADGEGGITPQMRAVLNDGKVLRAHHIQMLEFGMCQGALFLIVAVATPDTVDFLTRRYAPARVAGWLRPLN